MTSLTFKWDTAQLAALKHQGLEKALFRALSKAGGDAIRAMRTSSRRAVRERKRIKSATVAKGLVLSFPRGAKDIEDLEWRMGVASKMTPVAALKPRQNKVGVVAGINTGGRSVIKSAFIATMKSGHVGVFHRTGDAVGPRGGLRPMAELFTSRVVDVFRDADAVPSAQSRAQQVFGTAFARLLPLELAKAGAQ